MNICITYHTKFSMLNLKNYFLRKCFRLKSLIMPVTDAKINLIANKIRERREFMNYTQQYVAGKLNITQNAYSKIECGHIAINIQRLFEIAAALETDVVQFLV